MMGEEGAYLRIDEADLRRFEAKLKGAAGGLRRVAARALNSAMGPVITATKKDAAERLGVAQKRIKTRVWPKKATASQLRAGVVTGTRDVMMIYAKAKQGKRGVKYTLEGARHLEEGAFIAKAPDGQKLAWKRKGNAPLPLVVARTASPSDVLDQVYARRGVHVANARFLHRMHIETELLLSGRRA